MITEFLHTINANIITDNAKHDLIKLLPDFDLFPDKVKSGKKIYWKSKDGYFELFGFFNIQEKISPISDFYFYTANFFGSSFQFPWKEMPSNMFYLPILAYIRHNNKIYLYLAQGIDRLDIYERLTNDRKMLPTAKVMEITEFTSEHHWSEMIASALQEFEAGFASKIVLSRMSIAEFETSVSIYDILELLRANSTNSYLAFAELPDGDYFISASPETLFRREGKNIFIDALAGTCPVYGNDDLDDKMTRKLKNDPKELQEHSIVKEYIIEILNTFAISINSPFEPAVKRYATLQHLHTPIEAELTEIKDHELLEMIHPTPAVGGMPKDKALTFIKEYEDYHRGLYAAPFGFVSKDYTEFAVAIRSALIRNNKAYIFAGAGIVPDSNAVNEWLETNNKLDNFIAAMSYERR